MNATEIAQAVGRLRRAMPRNPDILLVCEAAEFGARTAKEADKPSQDTTETPERLAYNRFMRNYMRRWRARKPSTVAIAKTP